MLQLLPKLRIRYSVVRNALDHSALASSVRGMDHMVRHMHQTVGIELHTVIRMATLTPAKILGIDHALGSLVVGKRADLVLLDEQLEVRRVWLNGLPVG